MPAQPAANLLREIADIARRVRALERPQREVLTPALATAAATVAATSPAGTYVAVATGTGTAITWTVLVQPDPGSTVQLRLRDSANSISAVVAATQVATLVVVLPVHNSWQTGEQRLVWLDAWVDTGQARVLPVRAVAA